MKKKMVIGSIVAVVLCGGYVVGWGLVRYWRCGIKGVYQEGGGIPTVWRKALY